MNKNNKGAIILIMVVFASGCANSKLGDAAVAGASQTVKFQK